MAPLLMIKAVYGKRNMEEKARETEFEFKYLKNKNFIRKIKLELV